MQRLGLANRRSVGDGCLCRPLAWATTQNNLGKALRALGERETAQLDEAVAAFGEALKEWTRERVPPQGAGTQNNLGIALRALGERESGTAQLEEAVAACRDALEVFREAGAEHYIAVAEQNLARAEACSTSAAKGRRRGDRQGHAPALRWVMSTASNGA